MSVEAVHGFIQKTNSDAELGALVTQILSGKSNVDLVDLAGRHGFTFSSEEGIKVWNEMKTSGELPDRLLEAVAGGTMRVGGIPGK